MIFEKANYHCLQTCLSNAFPCFAFKAPRVKPLARIPPIPPQRRAPCPGFLSGARGYFLFVWCFFGGLCFHWRNRRRAGGLGEICASRAAAPHPRKIHGGDGEAGRAFLFAFSVQLRKNLFKMIFLLSIMPRIRSGGRDALPGEDAPGCAGMLRDAPGCAESSAGLPRQRSPPAQAPRLISTATIFILYDFYHLQLPLASFNPLCPQLRPLGRSPPLGKAFLRVG